MIPHVCRTLRGLIAIALVFIWMCALPLLADDRQTGIGTRMFVIGASVSAGFIQAEPLGGLTTPEYRLRYYLDAALSAPHEPVKSAALAAMFLNVEPAAQMQIDQVIAAKPTVTVGVDFLFWFCYGRLKSTAERLALLEKGLALLERIPGALVVGDLPDASSAIGGMLDRAEVPELETINAANRRIREWAAAHPSVLVLPLADFMATCVANKTLQVGPLRWLEGTSLGLLQPDRLHPSRRGNAALALSVFLALNERGLIPKESILWDDNAIQIRAVADSQSEKKPVAHGAPPKLVSTIPKDSDLAVPASLSEIVLEFVQDMNQGGFSVTGGGPAFPKITGKPRWVSARRFVLPVELAPGHRYQFGVNSPTAWNFKSTTREPVEPVNIRFKTAGGPGAAVIDAAAATAALQILIRDRYSYRDRVVKDWDALFAASGPALKAARTADDFAIEIAQFLKPANDPHLTVKVGEDVLPTMEIKLTLNADRQKLAKAVPGWRPVNRVLVAGRFADGIGYLMIPTWEGSEEEYQSVHLAIDLMKGARGVVLDMRFNSGGSEDPANRIAARFASQSKIFAKHRVRDPAAPGGWSEIHERILAPDPGPARRFTGPVAVLMGGRCFSSNESFLLMMRAAGARLIGERSFGSSGNPKPQEIAPGVALSVPSWEAQDAGGRIIEGRGIEPDDTVIFRREDAGDAVLDAGLKWIRQ